MRAYFLILLFLIPISSAQNSIFDILDEKYIVYISELPYSSGNPQINWQKNGHIEAWIDIVGFKNSIKENGVYYINEDPASLAVVQYGYSHDIDQNFDSIAGSISFSQSNNNLIAYLTVVLKWHVWCKSKTSSWICGRFTETKTFQDVEIMPKQYFSIHNIIINIIEYNNSINPRTVLDISTDNISYIIYIYRNESIINYLKTARVEKTAKGIYFANVSSANIWTTGTNSFHQAKDKVIIQGTARPDYQNLTVQVSNIFENKNVSEYYVVRDTYTIGRSFGKVYIAVLATFIILTGMILSIGRRTF